jgi:hypothetical protein
MNNTQKLINVYQRPVINKPLGEKQAQQMVRIKGLSPEFLKNYLTIYSERFRPSFYGVKKYQFKERLFETVDEQEVDIRATLLPYVAEKLRSERIKMASQLDPNNFTAQSKVMVERFLGVKSGNRHHIQHQSKEDRLDSLDEFLSVSLCKFPTQGVIISSGFKKERKQVREQLEQRGHKLQKDIDFESANEVHRAVCPVDMVACHNPDIWHYNIILGGNAALRKGNIDFLDRTRLTTYLYTTVHEDQSLGNKDKLRLESRFGRP